MGAKFSHADPNIEYTVVGFGQNATFVVFGAYNDTPNNRYTVKSFKLADVTFKGQFS